MQTALFHSTTVLVAAVAIVLLAGLRAMVCGSSPSLSQRLMRWRVGLQFVAVVVIMLYSALHHA